MIKYVSLFSGVEAFSVAVDGLPFEPLAFCEIDRFPSEVLAYRFPSVPNLGDITKVDWSDFIEAHGRPDLIVGGSPCQSFSTAGRREGLAGASGLMFEYIRAVQELSPRWFLWENVPGALSSEKGEAFRQLLASMDELGYSMCWRVLDAQFFGVPQRRERVFLVGHLGAEPPIEVLFEREGMPWNPRKSKEKRKELAARTGRSAACSGFIYENGAKARGIGEQPECAPTVKTSHAPALYWTRADDNANAATDADMVGTLKCAGSPPHNLRWCEMTAGTLTAHDAKEPCADDLSGGKVVVQCESRTS